MITRIYMLLAATLFAFGHLKAADPGTMTISISGFEKMEGDILVAVFDSEDDFLKEVIYTKLYAVKDLQEGQITVNPLPPGDYAISIVHDLNTNGVLDTNFIGIPKEPFGFSNNPRLKFGPPSFTEAKFTHLGDTRINIVLSSYKK